MYKRRSGCPNCVKKAEAMPTVLEEKYFKNPQHVKSSYLNND